MFWPRAVLCAKVSLSNTVTRPCFTPALRPDGTNPLPSLINYKGYNDIIQYMKLRLMVRTESLHNMLVRPSVFVCLCVCVCVIMSPAGVWEAGLVQPFTAPTAAGTFLFQKQKPVCSRLCIKSRIFIEALRWHQPVWVPALVIGSYQVASASIPKCCHMDLETIHQRRALLSVSALSNFMEMKYKQVSRSPYSLGTISSAEVAPIK